MKKRIWIFNINAMDNLTLSDIKDIDKCQKVYIDRKDDLLNIKNSVFLDFKNKDNIKNEISKYNNVSLIFDTALHYDLLIRLLQWDDVNIMIKDNHILSVLFFDQNYKMLNAKLKDMETPDCLSINIIKNIDKHNNKNVKNIILKYFDENIDIFHVTNLGVKLVKLSKWEYSGELNETIVIPKQSFLNIKGDYRAFMELIEYLRSDKGCPWDRKQTHKSLKKHLIEESYEVLDAIDNDMDSLMDELGDLLMQVALHSQIGKEEGLFDYEDVISNVSNKLIRRHPYVFEDEVLEGDDTSKVWNNVKKKEKSFENYRQTLTDVPKGFPALLYAQKIQKRAKNANFDFSDYRQAIEKLYEEIDELKSEINVSENNLFEEAGDLLFSVVNVLRLLDVDCEEALLASVNKFTKRFSMMEKLIEGDEKDILNLEQEILEKYWEKAKILLK